MESSCIEKESHVLIIIRTDGNQDSLCVSSCIQTLELVRGISTVQGHLVTSYLLLNAGKCGMSIVECVDCDILCTGVSCITLFLNLNNHFPSDLQLLFASYSISLISQLL